MYFKKLIGEKLYLSPVDKNDFELFTNWINDMEVSLGTLQSKKIIGLDEEKEILERLSRGGITFTIVDMETNKAIGYTGFPQYDYINRNACVAITIGDKNYWRKGYGQETLKLLIDYGFSILNFHNINLTVFEYNKNAIESYKKVGFKEVGRLREAKFLCGIKYDKIIMDILSHEFRSVT
jgi:RimJ/RimL family protein N-acetyltransferase